MPLNDDAVYLPARGYIYTAPRGTAAPSLSDIQAIPDTEPSGWDNLGHTSEDDLPAWGHDGGDPEVKGTWQNRSLRSVVTEAAKEYLTFNAHQVSRQVFQYYWGRGDGGSEPGSFVLSANDGQNPERAFLIVIVDGQRRAAFYAPRVSLSREDDLELDTDSFMALPIRATILQQTGQEFARWISPAFDESGSTGGSSEEEVTA